MAIRISNNDAFSSVPAALGSVGKTIIGVVCICGVVFERGSFHLSLVPVFVLEKPFSGKSVMQRAEKTGGGRK